MTNLQASAQRQLTQLIEQIERLESEKAGIADDVRDKFLEAKGLGFDPKIMKKVLKLRKMSKADREEEDAILTVYMQAVGLLGTPLGEFADRQDEVMASNVVRL